MTELKRCATAGPKMSHYPSDGTGFYDKLYQKGRDTYIGLQNGGIWKEIQIFSVHPEIGTFGPKRSFNPPAPIMQAKYRHYQSDGSGRDNYVINDEGGLTSTAKFRRKRNFFTSLRDYEKKPVLPQMDLFTLAQTPSAQSTKHFLIKQELSISQQKLCKRLKTPKKFEDPYKPMRRLTSAFYGKQSM
ncbi:hypothetical protein pb186bvf_012682 [Paramecium bursaria]